MWGLLTGAAIGAAGKWVMVALGFGFAFYGFTAILEAVTEQVLGNVQNALVGAAAGLAGLLRVDQAINVILSAYAVNGAVMIASRVFKA